MTGPAFLTQCFVTHRRWTHSAYVIGLAQSCSSRWPGLDMALARRGAEILATYSGSSCERGTTEVSFMQKVRVVYSCTTPWVYALYKMAAPHGSCVGTRRPKLVSLRLTSSSIAAQSLFVVIREFVRRPEGLAILACLLQVRVWIGILRSTQTRIAL